MEKIKSDIFNKYTNDLYRLAFSYTHKIEDTDDIIQNVFIKFYKNSTKLKINELEIKKWLVVTTINECKDLYKSRWKSKVSLMSDELNFLSSVSDKESIDLFNALDSLKPKYRLVIHLYYYMGYSIKEISKAVKISESAVKLRLLRARKIIKNKMEDYNE